MSAICVTLALKMIIPSARDSHFSSCASLDSEHSDPAPDFIDRTKYRGRICMEGLARAHTWRPLRRKAKNSEKFSG